MMRILMAGVGCVFLAAAAALQAGEPVAPKEEIALFNGQDLSGWEFCLAGDTPPAATFSVSEGVIRCTGRPNGYMRTKVNYKDYKLTIEWRFVKAGNSGVLLHVSAPDKVWPRSIECQGMFRNQGDFYLIGGTECNEHKGKKGRRVPKRGESNEKPLGEWNLYEIICRGDVVQPYVNGKLMNEATGCTVTEGMIAIQSEGGVWECRKITLSPLPPQADEPGA